MTVPLYCLRCRITTAISLTHLQVVEAPHCLCGRKYVREAEAQAFWQKASSLFRYRNDYKGGQEEIKVRCLLADHGSMMRADLLLASDVVCPVCQAGPRYTSKGEQAIGEWLTEHKISFVHNHVLPGSTVKGKRPDFRVDSLKLLIEFDGVQHFKPDGRWVKDEEALREGQRVDIQKTLDALRQGYRLARIDHMWESQLGDAMAQIVVSRADVTLSGRDIYYWLLPHLEGRSTHYLTRLTPPVEIKTEGKGDAKAGCLFILTKGARAGQACGGSVAAGSTDRCSRHTGKEGKKEGKKDQNKCIFTLLKGARAGQPCGGPSGAGNFCQRHLGGAPAPA